MKIDNISFDKNLIEAVKQFKTTTFYNKYVNKIYLCQEDDDRLYFRTDSRYFQEDIESCYNELGSSFEYLLCDAIFKEPFVKLYEVE